MNYEHNLFLSTHKNGDLVNNIKYKFDELWDSSFSLTNEWINEYKQSFEYQTLQKYLITLLFKIQILKSLMNQNL